MQDAYHASRKLVLRYFAEEMTIETMLRNGVYAAELQYLPFDKRSSYYYIYSSGQAALKELTKFSNEMDHLITEATDKGFTADHSALSDLRLDAVSFEGEIAERADDASTQFESTSETVGQVSSTPSTCEHLREAQELTEKSKLGAGL
jgi:hypothetical protein